MFLLPIFQYATSPDLSNRAYFYQNIWAVIKIKVKVKVNISL